MPFYHPLKTMNQVDRRRTIAGIERLRAALDANIPERTDSRTLILGTWNLRNFDDNRFGNGYRTLEDFTYIAEICARFDVIALQEICDDLQPLKELMRLLGHWYDYIITDVTEGTGGNGERLGFVYDTREVQFKGVAGEIVLPDSQLIKDGERTLQFSRTPFMCAFQAGWFKFEFATVHIYFGNDSGQKYRRRVSEIDGIAKFLKKRAKASDSNYILVGDFNIKAAGSDGFNALEKNGFTVALNHKGSTKDQTKFYDQISFLTRKDELRPANPDHFHDVFQFFDCIFREEDFPAHRARVKETIRDKLAGFAEEQAEAQGKLDAGELSSAATTRWQKKLQTAQDNIAMWSARLDSDTDLKDYYMDDWRTFHASDHLPLWVELEIDFSDAYLEKLKE